MGESEQQVTEFFTEWANNIGPDFLFDVLVSIVIVIVGRWVARFLTNMSLRALKRGNLDQTLERFFGQLIYYLLLALVIVIALANVGIPTASLIAILGASALAIGLALQDTLSNVASGVSIIFLRPYKIGDLVEIAGELGTVSAVSFFHTEMRTPENKVLLVPNSDVMDGNILNYSELEWIRVDMTFGIGYGDDLLKAKRILQEIVGADERIAEDPPPLIAVQELGDSSVNLAVRPYTKLENAITVRFDITEKVKLRFDAEGITIPYPQRDIHLIGSASPLNGNVKI